MVQFFSGYRAGESSSLKKIFSQFISSILSLTSNLVLCIAITIFRLETIFWTAVQNEAFNQSDFSARAWYWSVYGWVINFQNARQRLDKAMATNILLLNLIKTNYWRAECYSNSIGPKYPHLGPLKSSNIHESYMSRHL